MRKFKLIFVLCTAFLLGSPIFAAEAIKPSKLMVIEKKKQNPAPDYVAIVATVSDRIRRLPVMLKRMLMFRKPVPKLAH